MIQNNNPTPFSQNNMPQIYGLGGGGGGNNMEPRIAALEANMQNVQKDVSSIIQKLDTLNDKISGKAMQQILIGCAAVAFVIGLGGGTYALLHGDIGKLEDRVYEMNKSNINNGQKLDQLLARKH